MTIPNLIDRARCIRRETIRVHGIAPSTRIASSLSAVEILVALYYGGVMEQNPKEPRSETRDRLIVSKGHGAIAMYPILADLGYFDPSELDRTCKAGSFLGGIPDTVVPGFETINGSLGHGLGVAAGMALALRLKGGRETVFVLLGDGELYEGSVWEAIMFAGHHRLDNLVLIVDNNRVAMLDYCQNIIGMEPLVPKFEAFGWSVKEVDGHDVNEVQRTLQGLKANRTGNPKVLVANTVKGKGIPFLESDSLCHLRTLTSTEVEAAIRTLS